jgi:hypothetical protein
MRGASCSCFAIAYLMNVDDRMGECALPVLWF